MEHACCLNFGGLIHFAVGKSSLHKVAFLYFLLEKLVAFKNSCNKVKIWGLVFIYVITAGVGVTNAFVDSVEIGLLDPKYICVHFYYV